MAEIRIQTVEQAEKNKRSVKVVEVGQIDERREVMELANALVIYAKRLMYEDTALA